MKRTWKSVARRLPAPMIALMALTGMAQAAHTGLGIEPVLLEGNPSCATLDADDVNFPGVTKDYGFKIENDYNRTVPMDASAAGTTLTGTAPADSTNTVTVASLDGVYVDWSSTLSMDAVIVKGGPDGNAYVYYPQEVTGDTGLHSPINPSNGEPYAISHIEFCYDYELTAAKTANTAYTRTYTWDISKSVDPATHSGFAGDAFSSSYDVTVDRTTTDSGWTVSGTITVTNGTPFTTTFSVTDSVGGQPATVTCPTYTLAPGASTTCDYSADVADGSSGTNTATVTSETAGVGGATATADYVFGAPTTIVGEETVNVTDTFDGGPADALGSATGDDPVSFPYSRNFSCPTDPSFYTNGQYQFVKNNTAEITETGQTDSETVTVTCYAPVVTKDAAGSYDETWTWTVEKTVDPASQSGFFGDPLNWTWTVTVSESSADSNYAVTGSITVQNPNPNAPMTVTLSDQLNDGTNATVDCDGAGSTSLTVPAGSSASCDYSASPADDSATLNTATAAFNGGNYTGTAAVAFTANVINGTATLNDPEVGANGLVLTAGDGGTRVFTGDDSDACSSDQSLYAGDGSYSGSDDNTATLTPSDSGAQNASATTTWTCYAPVVSKTAAGSYDERHDWDVSKTVDPESQGAFAGDDAGWTWTIDVIETVVDQNFAVTGTISVQNPNPDASMTVTVSDVLDDGTAATVDCGGGSTSLTVAAGSTGNCSYDASPADASATLNTATAAFNSADFSATAAVVFTANVINDSATLNDEQIGLTGQVVNGGDQFTGDGSGTCSSDQSLYGEDGTYSFTEENTATLTDEEGTVYESTATTTVTCYAPVVTKDAAGSYDERHTWTIEKTVEIDSTTGFPGDTITWTWTINVSETFVNENYAVTGSIYVQNPAGSPGSMTVSLSDQLNDGTFATVDCDGAGATSITVASGTTGSCSYTAAPADDSATLNTATGTFNGGSYSGTAAVAFAVNVIDGQATLTDPDQGVEEILLAGEGPWTFTNLTETDVCAEETSTEYGDDGQYTVTPDNTATIVTNTTSTSASATAETEFTCYIPGSAKVIKTTTEGDEDIGLFPFSFELYDPDGTLQETVNLNGAGEATFTTDLETEGDWTVEEVLPDGWVSTTDLTCTFNVTYPAAANFVFECTFDNVEKSRIDLLKLTNGIPREDQTWSFELYEYADPNGGFGGTVVASDSTPPALLDFDNTDLDPFAAYTLCELGVPAGYSSVWRVDLDGDGVFETGLMPYNPNQWDDPPEDLGNRCIDINYDSDGVGGADIPLTPGLTLSFEVDNQKPGGAPRTPGYWKNWNTCTGGMQQYTAANNGGWQEGFWLLEDVLDPNIGGGIVWDDILADAFEFPITTCEVAVDILDKRLVGDPAVVGDGRKQSSDPLHNLATHLLAAQLNFGAGACDTQEVRDRALEAEELLDKYDFDGDGHKPLKKKDPDADLANELASFLDGYNNGEECGDTADKPIM